MNEKGYIENKFYFSSERIPNTLEAFEKIKMVTLEKANVFRTMSQELDSETLSVNLEFSLSSFEHDETTLTSEVSWFVTMKTSNSPNSNIKIISRIGNDESDFYYSVPPEDVFYEIKKDGSVVYCGGVFGVNKFLEEFFDCSLEDVPEDWSIHFDIENYFYDKYNNQKNHLY